MSCIVCDIGSAVGSVGGAIGSAVCSIGSAVGSAVCSIASNPEALMAIAAMVVAPELAPALIGATGSTLAGTALTGAAIGGGEGLIGSGGCLNAAFRGALTGGISGGLGGLGSAALGSAASSANGAAGNGLYGLCLGGYGGPAATYSLAGLCPTNVALGAAPAAGITSSLGSGFYCEFQQPTCNLGLLCKYGGVMSDAAKIAARTLGSANHTAGAAPGTPGRVGALQPNAPSSVWLCGTARELSTGPGTTPTGLPIPGTLYPSLAPLAAAPACAKAVPSCIACKPITGFHGAQTNMVPAHAEGGAITGLGALAEGGLPSRHHPCAPEGHKPEFITGLTGFYARGRGTGQSDDIPAMLHEGDYVMDADSVAALGDGSSKAGAERLHDLLQRVPHHAEGGEAKALPAKIADGEWVFPAPFVTALGDGDNKRGADLLDGMREALRAHKRSAPDDKIPPKAKSPLEYLEKARG